MGQNPQIRSKANSDYIIGLLALGKYQDLPAVGPDFKPQQILESGWVFYWDGDKAVRYLGSGTDTNFALLLSFKKQY